MANHGPGYTDTITVSSVAATAVTAQTQCNRITVGEDPSVTNWPTENYKVLKPFSNSNPRQVPIGATYTFERIGVYYPGDIAGYVQGVTGTTTFFQDEQMV